ncbi:MAG TPA: ATP-binding protein [Longimicrobiales bacterium]
MPEPESVADSTRVTRWDRIGGPVLTLVAAAALELLARTPLYAPTPAPILTLLVVYSAFRGGIVPGLASAAIALLDTMAALALPGTFLAFTETTLRRVIVFGATLVVMVFLVGRLKESVARLVVRERLARGEAERAARWSGFLSEASRVLASSLGYEDTLRRVARLGVPMLADWCLVDLLENGRISRVEIASRGARAPERAEVLRRYPRGPDATAAMPKVLRTGIAELIPDVSAAWAETEAGREAEFLGALHKLGARSAIVVPLVARGRTLGALTFIADASRRPYDRHDLDAAVDLAGRAALAVDNARLFREADAARHEAERHAREETALRQATAAVTATTTVEDAIRQIAESAVAATAADGAFVEVVDAVRQELEVVGVAGAPAPMVGERVPFPGSIAQRAMERGEPELVSNLSTFEGAQLSVVRTCPHCPVVIVPLVQAGETIGALVLLRWPEEVSFTEDELERAKTFGQLAALAFRKVSLLEESEQRMEELERITESRAGLMRGFSHDLKNPLGAADGQLQLLEAGIVGELTEKQVESIERCRRSIRSALDLIDDVLELARAEAGQLEIESVPTDVREAVRHVAEEYRAQAEAAGLEFAIEVPDTPAVTRSDGGRIRQILGNLVANAIKYTERGGVTVRVAEAEDGRAPAPGRWITIAVVDTGPGLSQEEQRHLFQEFTRLRPRAGRGAGLGLAISRRIAHLLGGEITVQSEVGRGSTFTLWLPLTPPEGRPTRGAAG